MDITHSTPVPDGKLPVRLYAAGTAYAFARVYLSDSAGTALDVASTDDADRLILAGITAKTMLLGEAAAQAEGTPLASLRDAPHYEGLPVLDDDGDDRDDADIDARDAAEAGWCAATSPTRYGYSKVACTLRADHDGDHVANGTGNPPASWPEGGRIDWDSLAERLAPPHGYTTPAVEIPPREPDDHLPQHAGPSRACTICGEETGEDGRHVNRALPLPGKGVAR